MNNNHAISEQNAKLLVMVINKHAGQILFIRIMSLKSYQFIVDIGVVPTMGIGNISH